MTKKTFFYNINNLKLYNLKLINKEIIPKSFIRQTLSTNKNIKIIDNFSSINDVLLKNKKNNNKKKIGSLIKIENQILKNKFWHNLKLNVPIIRNEKNNHLAIKFAKNYLLFFKKKKILVSILEIKKGGFIVRSFGMLGFLPLKQYLKENTKKVRVLLNKSQKKIISYYFTNNCKFSIAKKTAALSSKKKKWKFIKKAQPWFIKIKRHKKKKKFKRISEKTLKKKIIQINKKKKIKRIKCPFIFYNNIFNFTKNK